MGDADAALAARIPQLLSLRDAIYSPTFRDFIRDITGCGPLSDRTDCSCNVYARGSHLLCHDDVIGTRRVSYIIYLTEPDEGWTPADGGALELYPLVPGGAPGDPAITPSASLLPLWNSMAMFTVRPGVSFHAVQEVFGESKLRMSISGWYHAADAPPDMALATLSQLQARGADDCGAGPFMPIAGLPPPALADADADADAAPAALDAEALAPPPLSDAERALLEAWVNPDYLKPEGQARVAARFTRDSSVQLHSFLRADRAAALAAATAAADAAAGLGGGAPPRSYGVGTGAAAGWRAVGPSHKQRFLRAIDDADAADAAPAGAADAADAAADAAARAAAALLSSALRDLFASSAFAKLLWSLTQLRVTSGRALARRFRPGLDYTVAHYGILTREPRLDATLAFVAAGGAMSADAEDTAALWASGDVGGFECYLTADEGGEAAGAADVYRANPDAEEEDLLSVSAAPNTLSLVHRRVSAGVTVGVGVGIQLLSVGLRLRFALLALALHTLRYRCCSRATLQAASSLCRQQDRSVSYAGCALSL
jgi:hypothetical protein